MNGSARTVLSEELVVCGFRTSSGGAFSLSEAGYMQAESPLSASRVTTYLLKTQELTVSFCIFNSPPMGRKEERQEGRKVGRRERRKKEREGGRGV